MTLPTIETIRAHGLEPFVQRALGLVHAVKEVQKNVWLVNGHVVEWRGSAFSCDCTSFLYHGEKQGGHCKHTLAVCLQDAEYRARVIEALEVVHV